MSKLLSSFALLSLFAIGAHAAPDHVVPYAGVIDKNGAPFSGVAVLNFGLFRCPTGNCEANNTLVWQASGNGGSFPASDAVGVDVTANGGKFSVLLGDTGQTALVADVWRTPQLHVRIAVKAGTTWVPLSGFQRIAPVATAITAEEAASFTVRQDLTVAGNANVTGAVTANRATLTGALTTGSATTGTLTASGTTTLQGPLVVRGQVAINDVQLRFRDATDANHGARFTNVFGAATGIDGPVMWGNSGGGLGTGVSGNERLVLRWSNAGNVDINNNLNAASYSKNGDPLYIVCSANRTETHNGSTGHSLTFTAAECGNPGDLLFSGNYVGILGQMNICNNNADFHSVVVRAGTQNVNAPDVLWRGTACGAGTYNITAIYLRK